MAQITKLIKLNQSDIYSSVHRNCDDLRGLVSGKYQLTHRTRLLWYIEIPYGSLDKLWQCIRGTSWFTLFFYGVLLFTGSILRMKGTSWVAFPFWKINNKPRHCKAIGAQVSVRNVSHTSIIPKPPNVQWNLCMCMKQVIWGWKLVQISMLSALNTAAMLKYCLALPMIIIP